MKVVTVAQMRAIEQAAGPLGLPVETLMENAGLAFAREVERHAQGVSGRRIVVLAGPGNNGGDGLVAARHLHDWGARISVYLLRERPEDEPIYRAARERAIPTSTVRSDPDFQQLDDLLTTSNIVIDAILGTGASRSLQGPLREMMLRVRQARKLNRALTVYALDLPTGLDADTGVSDPAVAPADVTIALGFPKVGLYGSAAADVVGKIVVADIGLPPELGKDIDIELMTPEWAGGALPARPLQSNKGTFGKLLVVAGSVNYTGAAYLASLAAARTGAGLVTLALARSLHPILAAKLNEVTFLALPESEPVVIGAEAAYSLADSVEAYDAVLVGCGMGQNIKARDFIRTFLFAPAAASALPQVIDADGLSHLISMEGWWRRLGDQVVLTPHPGEMGRLLGIPVVEVQADRLGQARRAAAEWGKVIALKGANTIVAGPDGKVLISPWANPSLATAGTGDVLAGAIAGFLAQGLSPHLAAACGVYVHGLAGEMVRKDLGDAGALAGDLLPLLPRAIKQLKQT